MVPRPYVALDLEATSPRPEEAWILEIAAKDGEGRRFHRYVATPETLGADHEAFRFTGIPFEVYQREKVPPERALREFLEFLGERRLLGHNLLGYDLPLLKRYLREHGLELPPGAEPALDTLRLAHLVFPTPPPGLSGYRLGELHLYLTGQELGEAHRAPGDVEGVERILAGLSLQKLPPGVARAWRGLGLPEGELFPLTRGPVKAILGTPARVRPVFYEGRPFPPTWGLGEDLLPEDRPAQREMFKAVEAALSRGERILLEAPTGTGKTKGYLYPLLRLRERAWVATHTKVLQEQVLRELEEVGRKGYRVKAVLVKSPKDTLCPEALMDLFQEVKEGGREEVRAAVALLLHYAALGEHDLEALPAYWQFSPGFREVREGVGTNPSRCRVECPFFQSCAYQQGLKWREEAQILVTNQAYLLAHFLEGGGEGKEHLVVDEAHHLEETATEALTLALDHEALLHQLNRLAHPEEARGLLLGRRLAQLPKEAQARAREVAQELLPQLREALEGYTRHLVALLKNRGSGDPRYGLSLGLSSAWLRLREWPLVNREEERLIHLLGQLLGALRAIGLGPELPPLLAYLEGALALLLERRRVLGLLDGEPDPNRLHLSEWDPATGGWRHLAQPVDISRSLTEGLWPRFRGVVLTSATLSAPTEKDPGGFRFPKRILGLEKASHRRLPPSLPYEKAHLLVPRHLPEPRESTLPRFQRLLHEELRVLLPKAHRSLSLFTSLRRLEEARTALGDLPHLLAPRTRKEREEIARRLKEEPEAPAAVLGSRSYMEGVDFPRLRLVNLERIPFPRPSLLLNRRMARAEEEGLDPWWDYYLPKATLAFAQAFGRLIRDRREGVGDGAFILWDKRLLQATYQEAFYRALPREVHRHFPGDRQGFYTDLSGILGLPRDELPQEELEEETLRRLKAIRALDLEPLAKARRLAEEIYGLSLEEDRWAIQAQAIQAALEGQDLVALLPTGFGKSLAFQLPALMEEGLTLVVSPLVALMKDQADRLLELGLPVGALHSLMGPREQESLMEEVREGRVQLLYVSPERLNRSEALWRLLQEKHGAKALRRVVFDEAHCLLEWGFDFRPDYLKALERVQGLEGVPKSFFTATLTQEAFAELQEVAGLRDFRTVRPGSFHRPNLRFVVRKAGGGVGKFGILAKALYWFLTSEEGGKAIVYTATRAETERLAWALGRLFPELRVEAYHGGLGPLPRREIQERFMEGETRVVVATNAFGMGIDAGDIRLVVHWRPPLSLEGYIQQSGRAGRDGKTAYALLLHTQGDWPFLERMVGARHQEGPLEAAAQRLIALLQREGSFLGYRQEFCRKVWQAGGGEAWERCEEDLEVLLASLERAGILEYDLLPGKVLLGGFQGLEGELTPGERELLRRAGYGGEGEVLDLARLSLEEAQALEARLYALFREGRLLLYRYREPLFHIRAGSRLEEGYPDWQWERAALRGQALRRLEQVKAYAENGRCRAQTLLAHLGEGMGRCGVCDVCARDLGPWEGVEGPEEGELERAYRPLDALLAFFARAEKGRKSYLGKQSTLQALRGEYYPQGKGLGRRYTANPLFGHLFFLNEGELEEAFGIALRRGYIEVKGNYEGHPLYGLTPKGWRRYAKGLGQEDGDEGV